MAPDLVTMVIAVSMRFWGLAGDIVEKLPVQVALPAINLQAGYRPSLHDVTNWRLEAIRHLDAPFSFIASILGGSTPPAASRCVKLNNYWCIKRAGWNGEIASDSEGHVAFATAFDGARTAAVLLRRYYVDFDRHTALSIVSHWAPADCGVALGGGRGLKLAVGGLGGTLRARWLASHRHGGVPVASKLRRSVIPDRVAVMMPAPTIEAGVAEVPVKAINLDAVLPASAPKRADAGPGLCPGETRRIASYARQAIAGMPFGVNDDLHLFDQNGQSTPQLSLVMANMAAVEIGPLRVRPGLIAEAIAKSDAAHTSQLGHLQK